MFNLCKNTSGIASDFKKMKFKKLIVYEYQQ